MTTDRQSPRPVGVIGLGAMGAGIAASLRRAGCRVHALSLIHI